MVNSNDRVSIIMAAYNAEKTIKKAIQSVIAQSYPYWELLVINDCSKDSTVSVVEELAKTDARIRLMHNDSNSGVSKTRQRGVNCATGEWIAILDSDDAWQEDKLEKQLMLAKKKDATLVFTGSAFMDDKTAILDWQMHVPDTITYKQLLKQNLISNSSVLVKSDIYRKHFVVGDDMHEDYAIWLSMLKAGHIAYGIDEPLLVYRVTASSKTGNKWKSAKMQWKTYQYIQLNSVVAAYYMGWYTIKGLLKYRHLK